MLGIGIASAATVYVPEDYTEIQLAILYAADGDTIVVNASGGPYYENVVVNKQLKLVGTDMPIVNAGGSGIPIILSADGITLEGFKVSRSCGDSYVNCAGIMVTSNNNTITGNIVINSMQGIILESSSNNDIIDNTIKDVNAYAILLWPNSNNNNLKGNNLEDSVGIHSSYNNSVIDNNIQFGNYGIYLTSVDNHTIEDNYVRKNNIGIGLLYSSKNNTIINNIVEDNKYMGIYLWGPRNNEIRGNIVTGNIWAWGLPDGGGISIVGASSNTITENIVKSNYRGIWLWSSNDNQIYHNNIVGNSPNAEDNNPLNNYWHHPLLLEGNYWSDYFGEDNGAGIGKHAIADDGIGDTLIPHPSENYDNYPFIVESGWIVADSDDDGIPDDQDNCPNEDATGFDADNDGCIDSIDGIKEAIATIVSEGVISPELQNSLIRKVENAEKSVTKENICVAVNQLEASENEIYAQKGKKISEATADFLIVYINNVIADLLNQIPPGESC